MHADECIEGRIRRPRDPMARLAPEGDALTVRRDHGPACIDFVTGGCRPGDAATTAGIAVAPSTAQADARIGTRGPRDRLALPANVDLSAPRIPDPEAAATKCRHAK